MFSLTSFVITAEQVWYAIGFLGQGLFSMRFIVQWLASEKARKSVMPIAFWYFSVLGGITLLVYAIWREDPVFILGQAMGLVVYARNLYLIHVTPKKATAQDMTDTVAE